MSASSGTGVTAPCDDAEGVFACGPTGPITGARRTILANTIGITGDTVTRWQALAVRTAALFYDQLENKEGIWIILAHIKPEEWEWMAETCDDQTRRPPVASITGGQYISITGVVGFYDALDDHWTSHSTIPDDWFETRVFNLRKLTRSCDAKAAKWLTTNGRRQSG